MKIWKFSDYSIVSLLQGSVLTSREWMLYDGKVTRAAWALSFVADVLEILEKDLRHEKSQDCTGTIFIDSLWDILNFRYPFKNGCKCPTKLTNKMEA